MDERKQNPIVVFNYRRPCPGCGRGIAAGDLRQRVRRVQTQGGPVTFWHDTCRVRDLASRASGT